MKVISRWIVFPAVAIVATIIGFQTTNLQARKATPKTGETVVRLLSDHADPSAIAVTKGSYVRFNSADGKSHNIGQGSGTDEVHQAIGSNEHDHAQGGKVSGEFGADEAYRVQFNQVGTFSFHDHMNPKIFVTVVVYEKK